MDTAMEMTNAPAHIPDGMKWCATCTPETPGDPPGKLKLITDFYLASGASSGRRMHWCKDCHKRFSRENRRSRLVNEGQAYRDAENARVRNYMAREDAAEKRRAAERAKQAAMRALRTRHPDEYNRLLKAARINEGLPA